MRGNRVIRQGVDTPSNYIGCNHEFTIIYRVDNIGEEYAVAHSFDE